MAKMNEQKGAPVEEAVLTTTETFFLKYRNAFIIGIAAVVILIAGILLYQQFVSGPREAKASTALAKGQELFANEQYEKALNGDSASFIGFVKLADEYSGTDAANLAQLYAGLSYAKLGKWTEAVSCLEKFKGQDDQMISPAALGALGNAYANVKDYDKAVSILKKAAAKADNNTLSPLFLLQAGEILESQGKNADALDLYKDIKQKYIHSMQYQLIDKYIERVSQ